mmetsp:Transcript_2749/g.4704  ORF Transcript_2749/g.4704 Transcript_2749/m.4704 type:complete len:205 (-) Transcript_2749:462-1076(-)
MEQDKTVGKSVNVNMKRLAQKDESFNQWLKNFKEKNEWGFANIVDMTQESMEDRLLEVTPEMRKSQMVMMEEFRRRKNMEDYHNLMTKYQQKIGKGFKDHDLVPAQSSRAFVETINKFKTSNAERHFEPKNDEIFNPHEFHLMVLSSDSVTNVTSLNRVNHRRILIFLGNKNGLISYGKGKALEYEQAFDNAMKKARQNMVCLD